MPRRVQLKRIRGYRIGDAVKVDRTTKWGNPFRPGHPGGAYTGGRNVADKRHAAALYAGSAEDQEHLVAAARAELRGRDLACWCRLCDLHRDGLPFGERCPYCDPCHADTLGRIANQ
jgi:hypothetical protein